MSRMLPRNRFADRLDVRLQGFVRVDGEFQNSQEIDPCRNGVRIGFAWNGGLDASDRGIVSCVFQGNAAFRQRLDERNVIEEKGNAAATEDKLATTLEK